jgi:hypothetical protein
MLRGSTFFKKALTSGIYIFAASVNDTLFASSHPEMHEKCPKMEQHYINMRLKIRRFNSLKIRSARSEVVSKRKHD